MFQSQKLYKSFLDCGVNIASSLPKKIFRLNLPNHLFEIHRHLFSIFFCGNFAMRALKTFLYMPGTHINHCVFFSKCKHQVDKVKILWEGHKIWKNIPLILTYYSVKSKQMEDFFQIFSAYSENMNFSTRWSLTSLRKSTNLLPYLPLI